MRSDEKGKVKKRKCMTAVAVRGKTDTILIFWPWNCCVDGIADGAWQGLEASEKVPGWDST